MSEKKWTPQQMDAIQARGGTVLVSAAAGSGKTAVLVERVIGRILDADNPIDADRMLVVTFSNAAALEMKQRIMEKISGMIAENPADERLQRQQLLLERAQISTIHAFCLELIRTNFQKLGISSNVRTGDEKELEILRRDIARETVERFHADGMDGTFARLVELLSSGRDDSRVFSTLFRLYDFVRSHPFYNDWLDHKLGFYDSTLPVEGTIWGQSILGYAREAVEYAIGLTRRSLAVIELDEAMSKAYLDGFLHDLSQLEQLFERVCDGRWDGICEKLDAFSFDKLSPLRNGGSRKEAVQGMRSQVKKLIEDLRDKQFCATAAEFSEDIAFLRPMVEVLFELVKAFDRAYTDAKQQRNLMDFSDMEQYAIELLVKPAGAGYSRTPLAESVSELYDEILVDEFQDTNAAQEILFRAVSRGEENLFMVGDVKQSIYRFRQAMPELFLEKKKKYQPYDGTRFPAKIVLGKNFRSAPEITGSINFFFRSLMSEKLGEIAYNEEEELVAGAQFPDYPREGCTIDLIDLSEYAGEQARDALEADFVAERIAGLLTSGILVADGEEMRRITPKDICILMRSPSRKAQLYQEALSARGVPVWAEPKSSFLTTREIAPVLSLLRVIENPLLDIDLTAVMFSPFLGFTADEMSRIRLERRRAPLWTAVNGCAENGDVHCQELVEAIFTLRQFASSSTADQVIRKIYDRFDYPAKVRVMRMGQARYANLLLLVQYACDYHASGYKGLSGFVGFLDRLLERGGDLSPSVSLSEQADVVRIMSIHRSKGLEFPVVFLCDTAKQFNKEDLWQNTLLHSELGFACVRRDFELMKQFSTVPMQALRLEIERSSLSEELRVLYVALTRAKERLLITGISKKKVPEKLAGLVVQTDRQGRLPPHPVRGASCYLDWLLMAAVHHPGLARQLSAWGIETNTVLDSSPVVLRVTPLRDSQTPEEAIQEFGLPEPDPSLASILEDQLSYAYPFRMQTLIPTKMAVSQIAKREAAKSYRFTRRPAFLSKDGLTGAQRGNALHKFMQFADYRAAAEDPVAEIARMAAQGFLSREEADAVDPDKLHTFFSSELAERIFSSGQVYRELRFLVEAGQELLGTYIDLFDAEGKTAIQGVADCVFLEEGEAVIVDYKSDRVKDVQELSEHYRIQLELYRQVLGESLGVRVKECVIYSFALGKSISF